MRSLFATPPRGNTIATDAPETAGARTITKRSVRRALSGAAVAAVLLAGCTDPTDPELHLSGIVRHNGVALPGVKVYLQDSRGPYSQLVTLGTTTTNADGTYEIQAPSSRDGYVCGGSDNLLLAVEGFISATPSAPLRCTSNSQRIDLTAVDWTTILGTRVGAGAASDR